MKFLNYSLSLSLSLSRWERLKWWNFHKKTSLNRESIVMKSYLSRGGALGGARLSDERSEEMSNREGVAAGGTTQKKQNIFPIKTKC